ncbi:SAM-dependent methyltransferase [Amylibacter ulvae]|uniref:SAM-dependent methyltransferase n=1 Tax=Paramylibacter ulvae TaxID=1651968 RepID=A0ABQ3CU23_9RHOB|nr:RsmB/NOP family class I SAM-dependent RNA methyltransferase [Amylibacter ulvae]GHA40804.1 SAM-dependent methyltransferase [Amylibacter ulvae]
MTPAARYASAIDILDQIFDGASAEKTLTNWARKNRFAGSKDRAALRDIVFDCLRCKRSYQYHAGQSGGRGAVLGHVLGNGLKPNDIFSGEGYAPTTLSDAETRAIQTNDSDDIATIYDVPDWVLPMLQESLGNGLIDNLKAIQSRAPIDLRVNMAKTNIKQAQAMLARDDLSTELVDGVKTALRLSKQTRKIPQTDAYKDGQIELQDAGSQQVVLDLPLQDAKTVLDYCAGGGGKSLAMAALAPDASIDAYDKHNDRLGDLSTRAMRAGVDVNILSQDPVLEYKKYDIVVLDVPCSGTGAWRRNPDGKWKLTLDDLDAVTQTQSEILQNAPSLVTNGGRIAYITCSLLNVENTAQVSAFLAKNTRFALEFERKYHLTGAGDGFYLAILKNESILDEI